MSHAIKAFVHLVHWSTGSDIDDFLFTFQPDSFLLDFL